MMDDRDICRLRRRHHRGGDRDPPRYGSRVLVCHSDMSVSGCSKPQLSEETTAGDVVNVSLLEDAGTTGHKLR